MVTEEEQKETFNEAIELINDLQKIRQVDTVDDLDDISDVRSDLVAISQELGTNFTPVDLEGGTSGTLDPGNKDDDDGPT